MKGTNMKKDQASKATSMWGMKCRQSFPIGYGNKMEIFDQINVTKLSYIIGMEAWSMKNILKSFGFITCSSISLKPKDSSKIRQER